ncbi:MAG: helicase HerA-like domain-containing protein, partial [Cyclobacteriaceae bacterium]
GNRHGLVAGATGTGKTKTVQVMAEQLSKQGVPVLLMDLKGDLSGLAQEGGTNKHVEKRHSAIGIPYQEEAMPVELLSISDEKGVQLKATISEFGPVLFSKILGLNDVQSGITTIIFKYCDDNKLPLLDLSDFKKTLQYLNSDGKEAIEEEYGRIASSSVAAIMRSIVELEQQGADTFFGEPSFDVDDLVRFDDQGRGMISIIRLTDIQNRPKLFSTFMLCLLSEIYHSFPEEGDMDRPKLAIFIDEAHLVFEEASDALLDQLEAIIKLIRSKAVGIYFCTQNPEDIPDDILGQLGLKIQHALRAFTAKDRKAIKKTAENYPLSDYYKTDEVLTSLGIGEALITALNEKGIPTMLAATLLRAPLSRMDILSKKEIDTLVSDSKLVKEYNQEIDRESAYEILKGKMDEAASEEKQEEIKKVQEKAKKTSTRRKKAEPSFVEQMSKNTMVRQVGRTVARELMRGLLGVMGVKKTRSSSKSWF